MTAVAPMTPIEVRARSAFGWLASDDGAKWAFRLALVAAGIVYVFIGRHQWFVRDDFASILTRETTLQERGWAPWLMEPQDGHWLAVPVLVYHFTLHTFGLDSYWPFLIPTLLSHAAAVLLVRVLCLRNNVSAWTTTLVCTMLLVFGTGWENMVFAIQISYNFSLVAFLAQIVLIDHDGPVDRRDYIASALALGGVMSSGFGPIFMVGITVMLVIRRRWKALLVALVPQAALYGWWFLVWEADPARTSRPGNQSQLPAFVVRGLSATFDGLTSLPGLGGIGLVATLVVALTRGFGPRTHTTFVALTATVLAMFGAVGIERVGSGVALASSSRYLHIAALVIAPVFALAIDQLRRISREARWAGLLVVTASAAVNVGVLRKQTADWSRATDHERQIYELIAGSGLASRADPNRSIFVDSPDVTVASIASLVEMEAITPRQPANPEEKQIVLTALGIADP